MEERQREFEFMEEMQDRRMLRACGRVMASHCVDAIREPLTELIKDEVRAAISEALKKQCVRKGCDFVSEELKELVGEAFQVYFDPIKRDFERLANSFRDEDDADWWKRGGSDDDDE